MTDVVARLAAAGCVAPEDEAHELLRGGPDDAELEVRVRRREAGEPLAWIVGRTRFGGVDLRVAPGVYVPRAQTEELARRATDVLRPAGTAVDLCTGSGAVAALLQRAHPDAFVIGVDVDPAAVRCAASNGVRAVVGDLATPLHASGVVDVITAVAPYVPTADRALLPVGRAASRTGARPRWWRRRTRCRAPRRRSTRRGSSGPVATCSWSSAATRTSRSHPTSHATGSRRANRGMTTTPTSGAWSRVAEVAHA